ncbi:dihydrofolate reductase family protein [Deinococcus roseus]|uniref:Deaminase n=1 Tax=Deinococcus roseus TaxID=392414 RepID=A0ABQ2DGX6_9DEIO|nr:dihydrofolate reductase family protein [Deinococcus roseus]GGJ54487.1 deaminase [Deinococcus roseus]
MRKLIYYIASSLDGFIAGPDDNTDLFPLPESYLQHLIEHFPETLPTHVRTALNIQASGTLFDTVIMGRKTYDPGLKLGITSPYRHLKQYVVSRNLPDPEDPEVTLVREDVVGLVQQLKQQASEKHIWLAGGGQLASHLAQEIDEVILKLNPLVFGEGTPLFAAGVSLQQFELLSCEPHQTGPVLLRYRALHSQK